MLIDYHVSEDGLRIEAFPKGLLNIKETVAYFDRLINDKRIKQDAVEIVYFKHVTDFQISYSDGEHITKRYQEPKTYQKIKATIFVCERDLAYGMGRMLKTFHEITNPQHNVFVVRSEDELEDVINEI